VANPVTGSASAVLVRAEAFRGVGGFYEEADIPEDRDLWLRLAMIGEIDYVDEVLANVRLADGSRSSNPDAKRVTYARFLERHEAELLKRGLVRKARARYHSAMGKKYFDADRPLEGLRDSVASLRLYPRPIVAARVVFAVLTLLSGTSYAVALARLKRAYATAKAFTGGLRSGWRKVVTATLGNRR
jgi:hypothetical protein